MKKSTRVQTVFIRGIGRVPCEDAKKPITLLRGVLDILKGKRGKGSECMDARCVLRLAKRFPHRIYAVEITRSRMWAFDKVTKDGTPAHAVRYARPEADQHDIEAFDKGSPVPTRSIQFLPPPLAGANHLGPRGAHPHRDTGKHKRAPIPRKAKARLMVASGVA